MGIVGSVFVCRHYERMSPRKEAHALLHEATAPHNGGVSSVRVFCCPLPTAQPNIVQHCDLRLLRVIVRLTATAFVYEVPL